LIDRQRDGTTPVRPGEWRRNRAASQPAEAGPTTLPPMTDEERKDVEKFLKDNAPKRYEKAQDLQDDRQKRILEAARTQYRALQRLKEQDPQMYDIRIKRLPIMDDIFALGWDLRHGDAKSSETTRQKVRERLRQLIDSRA